MCPLYVCYFSVLTKILLNKSTRNKVYSYALNLSLYETCLSLPTRKEEATEVLFSSVKIVKGEGGGYKTHLPPYKDFCKNAFNSPPSLLKSSLSTLNRNQSCCLLEFHIWQNARPKCSCKRDDVVYVQATTTVAKVDHQDHVFQ